MFAGRKGGISHEKVEHPMDLRVHLFRLYANWAHCPGDSL